ncbi:MFS transporter [Streptomyces sp. NPDC056144]|uniref:MFS transporter n=1 Tax=unclassified Streptomyces TaxID=2593676 RepID=UPI0035DF20C4
MHASGGITAAVEQLTGEDPAYIGPYRLIARLGAGGMGLVYLGRSDLGRTVAVKVVQAEHAQHPEFRRRFAREVAAARRVGGDWTADVLDADTEAAVPWVATQYIPGPDLTSVVARDFGPLPEHSVRTLANRLALALQAVHAAGLIHRDLKPSNVLVTVDGPRVIDFGIARAMDSLAGDSLHTRTGMLIGSPGFMSPEQVRGLELTPASDVFCLGALLVYAATGRLLFGATDTGLNAHLFRVAEEEADLTGVPDALVDLVRACLEKDPAKRPTPSEVAARTHAVTGEGEWLPGTVLAQLGRRAAHLLDYAPAGAAVAVTPTTPAVPAAPAAPVVAVPPPPAYAPTAPAYAPAPAPSGAAPGRGLLALAFAQFVVLVEAAFSGLAMIWHGARYDLGLPAEDLKLSDTVYLDVMPVLYPLAFLLVLPFGARLAGRAGRKTVLVSGLVGFAVASAIGASATGSGMWMTARVLQGVFAALVTASVPGLMGSLSGPRKAFGTYAAVAGLGPALGVLCAWLLPWGWEWRWWMYATVSLTLVAVALVAPQVRPQPGGLSARSDGPGVAFAVLGIVAISGAAPYFTGAEYLLVAAGVLLAALAWRQTLLPGTRPRAPLGVLYAVAAVNGVLAVLFLSSGHYLY